MAAGDLHVEVSLAPWVVAYITALRQRAEDTGIWPDMEEIATHMAIVLHCGGILVDGRPI